VAVPVDALVAGAPRLAMLKRVASTLVLLPLFLLLVVKAPTWLFSAVVALVSGRAVWELTRMLQQAGRPAQRGLGVLAGVVLTASFGASRLLEPFGVPALLLTLAVAAALATPIWQAAAPGVESTANTLLAVVYVGWLLGYGILLRETSPNGDALVLFLVGVTWIGETAAYLVGSTVGRHRLAPVISPRKTVEGSVAQVIASIAAALVLGLWLLSGCGGVGLTAAGALLGIVGQVGDLAESVIKRTVGLKDTAALIPGHGGVLDRIDSLLFNLPAFYYFSRLAGCA
jgi:phosphatidate cytidylyltransferase